MAQQKTTARRQMKARSESTSKNGTRRAVARKSQNHSGSGAKFGVKLQKLQKLKVALACDWLTSVGGAEQVLLSLHKLFPQAPIYTSQYNPKGIDWFQDADVRTGWMQVLPSCTRRITPMFRQYYFNHLDLSEYDLVISVSGAEAKGIQTGPQTLHVSYCHVPTQYYWQLYDTYIENPGFGVLNPVVRLGFQTLVKPLRQGDFREAQKPDAYITISQYAAEQIKKYYQRPATIIAPPVAVDKFALSKAPAKRQRQGFVMTARQVSWKRHDLAIKACIKTKQKLTIIGDGPENRTLWQLAGDSDWIEFVPQQDAEQIAQYLWRAKGFLFPSLEPFGIAPVEALAAGCPVIAFQEGGSRDFIQDGKNGVCFAKQEVNSLVRAIRRFDKMQFAEKEVAATANDFAETCFQEKIVNYLSSALQKRPKHD